MLGQGPTAPGGLLPVDLCQAHWKHEGEVSAQGQKGVGGAMERIS